MLRDCLTLGAFLALAPGCHRGVSVPGQDGYRVWLGEPGVTMEVQGAFPVSTTTYFSPDGDCELDRVYKETLVGRAPVVMEFLPESLYFDGFASNFSSVCLSARKVVPEPQGIEIFGSDF